MFFQIYQIILNTFEVRVIICVIMCYNTNAIL